MSLYPDIADDFAKSNKRVGKIVQALNYWENGGHIPYNIKLANTGQLSAKHGGKKLIFFTDVIVSSKRQVVVGDSPEEVRIETERLLKENTQVAWTPMIRVLVSNGDDDYFDEGSRDLRAHMKFSYDFWEVGVTPSGRNVYREVFPGSVRSKGHIDNGKLDDVLIPHTPENEAALDAVRDGILRLGKALTGLLSQAQVIKTLANVKVLGLPAPTKKGT